MKHLFYIHSFVTYIVSLSIVSELKLGHRNVVFMYGRGFSYQSQADQARIETIEIPPSLMKLSKIPSYGERFLIFRRFSEIHQLDQLVTELVHGESFIVYLPLTKNFLMQLLATHPHCYDLIFLEEGLLTYTGNFKKQTHDYFRKGLLGKVARWIRYPNHGNRSFFYRPYPHSRPLPVYMLHEPLDSLGPEIEVRVLKKIVVPPVDPRFKLDNGYLLVVDTVVEDGITSPDCFHRALEFLANRFLKSRTDTLWIRFRPNHPVQREVVDLFEKSGFTVNVLPEGICVESVLYYSQNISVIGFHSSLLFYAAIWGCRSYSIMNILTSVDPEAAFRYRSKLSLPHEFFVHVTFL